MEWKWSLCRADGSTVCMERWTNRFTLLTAPRVAGFLILAPWEVYALVMSLHLENRECACGWWYACV